MMSPDFNCEETNSLLSILISSGVDGLVTLINLPAPPLMESNAGRHFFGVGLDLLQEISIRKIPLIRIIFFLMLFII